MDDTLSTLKDFLIFYPEIPHSEMVEIFEWVGFSRNDAILSGEASVTPPQSKKILTAVTARQRGTPLSYITNRRDFYGRTFFVDHSTLIPRPESEHLVEAALDYIQDSRAQFFRILDIGTGSGNLIITVLAELSPSERISHAYAIDISPEALAVAKKNARSHNLSSHITFVQSDLLKDLSLENSFFDIPQGDASFVFLANLPYVSSSEKSTLLSSSFADELAHEPSLALWSQEGGLAHYRELFSGLSSHPFFRQPRCSLVLFLEIDPSQEIPLASMIDSFFPLATYYFIKDYAGHTRICSLAIPS